MAPNEKDTLFSVSFSLERVRGIEPPCSAWEADILPLNYTRIFQLGEAYYNTPPGKLQAFFLPHLPRYPSTFLHFAQNFICILQFHPLLFRYMLL